MHSVVPRSVRARRDAPRPERAHRPAPGNESPFRSTYKHRSEPVGRRPPPTFNDLGRLRRARSPQRRLSQQIVACAMTLVTSAKESSENGARRGPKSFKVFLFYGASAPTDTATGLFIASFLRGRRVNVTPCVTVRSVPSTALRALMMQRDLETPVDPQSHAGLRYLLDEADRWPAGLTIHYNATMTAIGAFVVSGRHSACPR
jgi:hypothetical protein